MELPDPIAVIDIGTNTVRLIVARPEGPTHRTIHTAQVITRLGAGLVRRPRLDPAAWERTMAALRKLTAQARDAGAARVIAVATSAAREAEDGPAFCQEAAESLGIRVLPLSGAEEARLTAIGVLWALGSLEGTCLILDVGGGSTELTWIVSGEVAGRVSLPLGAVRLTEAALHHDPPLPQEIAAVRRLTAEALTGLAPPLGNGRETRLLGTAGTITTLAAIDLRMGTYDATRITGHRLDRDRVETLLSRLGALSLEERRRLPGLEPERADIIVAGAAITAEVMTALGAPTIVVSNGGLREGVLLDLLRRQAAHHAPARGSPRTTRCLDKSGGPC